MSHTFPAQANKHEPHPLDPKSGRVVHPEMGLTMSVGRLKSVLLARFPSLKDGRLLGRIAAVFDADNNGVVDFAEFATGLARIISVKSKNTGPDPDENQNVLEFVFNLFDKNGDGVVELWEICELVETAHDDRAGNG